MPSNGVAKSQAEATDLGSLWSRALEDYKKATGDDLNHLKAESLDEISRAAEQNADEFSEFRHKVNEDEKGDKGRHRLFHRKKSDKVADVEKIDKDDKAHTVDKVLWAAFGKHRDSMQKCWKGAETIVNAATGAFPPATPVSVLFVAGNRLLDAFAAVEADYDKVEDFFFQCSRFFERLSLIQTKISDVGLIQEAIFRIFATQLTIFGHVQKNTKEGRSYFKDWLKALWDLQDDKLKLAFANMEAAIQELSGVIGFAGYAAIKDVQDVTVDTNINTNKINENLQNHRSEVNENFKALSINTNKINENLQNYRSEVNEELKALYESSLDIKDQLAVNRTQTQNDLREMIKAMTEKSRPDTEEIGKRKQTTKGSGKGDAGDKKFKALRSIKSYFDVSPDIFPSWRDAQRENSAQKQDMDDSFVDHTGEWIAKELAFQRWTDGEQPLLWIKGPEGIGKTFLAYASFQKVRQQEDGRGSFAYFSFKEEFPYLQSVQNAFACAALQVAESNTRYAELVAKSLKDEDISSDNISTGRRLFLSPFSTTPQRSSGTTVASDQLYLVFDGLDEAPEQERQAFLNFLEDLKKEKSRVHILVTSRTGEAEVSEDLDPLVIEATKQKMLHDMRILISNRLNTLSRLKRFSPLAKRVIRQKVSRRADGMLYVEHMLRRLSYIGREGAVRKELEKLPNDLHDLYKLMLDECRRNRSKEQYETLKRLFAWLAFSKRSLSLAEASELVKLTVTKDDFDIEDEIIGRSSRILELSRTRNIEDDIKDELRDDDNYDHDDDHEVELNEYRNDALTFQERSLRQYFKAVSVEIYNEEEIRTPASAAHLVILRMCVDVLMNPENSGDAEEASVLRRYAVTYWYDHFNELEPAASSPEEIGVVLSLIHRITSNENNVAKVFYKFARQSEIYPERGEELTKPWYDRLISWAEKGEPLLLGLLTPEVRTWVAEIVAIPKDVLVPLARGHVHNWLAETDVWYILEAYRFAEATLTLAGRIQKEKDNSLEKILDVFNAFGARDEDSAAMRAIGVTLYWSHHEIRFPNDDHKEKEQSKAISYLRRAIDLIENDKMERAYTLRLLSQIHAHQDEYDDAVSALDASLANFADVTFSKDPEKQKKWVENECRSVYMSKAWYLLRLEKKDTALDMYNEARNLAKDGTIGGTWLDDIIYILDEKKDTDGHIVMDALKSWTDTERNSWFEFSLKYWTNFSALGRMYSAAKLSGETDIVLEWLNAFGKTLQPRSLIFFNLKEASSDFYNRVLDDVDRAKEELRNALMIQPKTDGRGEDIFHERISAVRMKLAGTIFSQFRKSCDPQQKEALVQEMRLPGMTTDDEIRESHIGMLNANMLRIMGPAREYQKAMDGIFKTCIDALEDNISWNDGYSLRLLVKVLSSLDSLERDACITLSLQFSVLDKSIYDNGADFKTASESGDTEGLIEQADTASEELGETGREKANTDINRELQSVLSTLDGLERNARTTLSLQFSIHDKSIYDNGADSKTTSKSGDTGGVEGAEVADKDNDAKAEEEKAEIQKDVGTVEVAKSELEPLDDDICDFPIFCDGGCGREWNSWTEPCYLCLICCPTADLCEECHAKRLAWNEPKSRLDVEPETGREPILANPEPDHESEVEAKAQKITESNAEQEPAPATGLKQESEPKFKTDSKSEGQNVQHPWITYCGENHHYIKGPMKGWRGVKNGIIRINDEELSVKDWIKGLKEDRWPKAWDTYWARQGGLKDIDVQ